MQCVGCLQGAAAATRGLATTVTPAWQCDSADDQAEWPCYSPIVRRCRVHAAEVNHDRLIAITNSGRHLPSCNVFAVVILSFVQTSAKRSLAVTVICRYQKKMEYNVKQCAVT